MNFLNFIKTNNKNHKSVRIKTDIGDKYLNVKLDQTYESLDILSLKVFQKDLYRLFDSDYAIIVGRVNGNQNTGIPNCRISVFIPKDEETITSPTNLEDIKKIQAASLYTYESVFDRDENGKVYNLLPKYSKNRNFNGFPDNDYGIGATPKTPVGTFPEKEEILANDSLVYVYDKYYKYTTVTNESGDYILVVPANKTFTVNMSCDITDIGRFSTIPSLLKLQGYPDNFFKNDNTTINDDLPLQSLPNIDIQNIPITTIPLWSQDSENTEVGINRLDFSLNKKIEPYVTVIGNYFTQNKSSWWGDRISFRLILGLRHFCFRALGRNWQWDYVIPFINIMVFKNRYCTLRGGKAEYDPFDIRFILADTCDAATARGTLGGSVTDSLFLQRHDRGNIDIKVFSIKNTLDENQCDQLNSLGTTNDQNAVNILGQYNTDTDIELLEENKYSKFINNGNFITLIPTNRKKVITNEEGNLIEVPFDSDKGVFTEFRGYFICTHLDEVDNPPTRNRTGKIRLKIPQEFDYRHNPLSWVWKHFKFEFGEVYSVAQYNEVRFANFNQNQEAGDDTFVEPNKTSGFDEQTNIFFTGIINEDNENIGYRPNNNSDIDFTSFYNHITLLGLDKDTPPDVLDNPSTGGGVDLDAPEDTNIYNFRFSIEGDSLDSPIIHTFTVRRTYINEELNEVEFTDIIINNILIENKPNPLNSSYSSFTYFITKSNNLTPLYEQTLTPTTVTGNLPDPIIITKNQISIAYPESIFSTYLGEYDAKLGIKNTITGNANYLPIKIRVISQ